MEDSNKKKCWVNNANVNPDLKKKEKQTQNSQTQERGKIIYVVQSKGLIIYLTLHACKYKS